MYILCSLSIFLFQCEQSSTKTITEDINDWLGSVLNVDGSKYVDFPCNTAKALEDRNKTQLGNGDILINKLWNGERFDLRIFNESEHFVRRFRVQKYPNKNEDEVHKTWEIYRDFEVALYGRMDSNGEFTGNDMVLLYFGGGNISRVLKGSFVDGFVREVVDAELVKFQDGRLETKGTQDYNWLKKEFLEKLVKARQIMKVNDRSLDLRYLQAAILKLAALKTVPNRSVVEDSQLLHQKSVLTYPWPSPPCSTFSVLSDPPLGSVNPTMFASFPGSGSKWIITLIERAVGIAATPDKIYWDFRNNNSASGVLIKTHYTSTMTIQTARLTKKPREKEKDELYFRLWTLTKSGMGRAILLIRDPRDAIVAWWNHVKSGGTKLKENFANLQESMMSWQFSEFSLKEIELWKEIAVDWITLGNEVLVVRYEEFVEKTELELRRILKFLNIEVNETRLECVMSHPVNNFRRTKKNISDIPLKKEVQKKLKAARKKMKKLLSAWSQEAD